MTVFALTEIPYLYPGGRNTIMWLFVAIASTALAGWRLAPSAWRPRGPVVPAVAVVVAYLVLVATFRLGFVQWLDHDVFERFRGGVDDVATWLVAAAGAAVGVALVLAVTPGDRR